LPLTHNQILSAAGSNTSTFSSGLRGSIPSAFAYGSLSPLPTLKPKITLLAPRLGNGGWLFLTM